MKFRTELSLSLSVAGLLVVASHSDAAMIALGTYQLHNHPDGNVDPPPYGMRLDELFDITAGHDDFTFDFDAAGSDVRLTYDGTTIHIFGSAFGGRDVGATYAVEPTTGVYTFDFVYSLGVAAVPGDDDIYVVGPDETNFGSIQPPVGPAISLADKSDGNFVFRFGDEDNDLGHRGFPGISGWGWMTHHFETQGHIPNTDWLFTAELIPAPSAASLIGLMGLGALRRRR